MAFRRSAPSWDLRNRTLWTSSRRKRAVCRANVLPSGLKERISSRLTRKTRATCRVNVQHFVLRKRQCCRDSSSWRKTFPGQWNSTWPPPLCSLICLTLLQHPGQCHTVNIRMLRLWSSTYWTWCCFVFFDSSRAQNAELSNSLKALERSQQELEKRLASLQLQHQQDSTKLQTQLEEADSRSNALQREVCSKNKQTSTCVS